MIKISFMTLGCPTWDLRTICAKGREYGFDGVDFRGLLDTLDVTTLPEFTSGVAATRRQLDDAGLAVSGISSSINVCVPEKRNANLEEARRTIPVANALGCQNIRIFGGGNLEQASRQQLADIGRACIEEILALEGAADLRWLFETHDLWIKAVDCKLLLDSIPNPAFGALWDMGHTPRVGGEAPTESYAAIGSRVGYTHVKDASYDPKHPQAMSDGWRYVPPGTGQLPIAEAITILKQHGYDGWLMFEHEKRWHPELPEPDDVLPIFVKWVKPLISA
jgi:sugar phosphate isomerase/epimerase